MNAPESIRKTAESFEKSFLDSSFYDSQTQDKDHLEVIINNLRLAPGKRILDLGTGTGYLAFPLARKNSEMRIIGIDIVKQTIERNKAKAQEEEITNLEFLSYEGDSFPFPDDYFDIVVTRYALHHFPDIQSCFSELSRVIKSQGQLWISDPTPHKSDKERFVDKFMQMKDDGHIKFYTVHEFTSLARQYGFHEESHTLTKIQFPRIKSDKYSTLINKTTPAILELYEVEVINNEVFISEDVVNISFCKEQDS
ncbi:MAG: class I SAM-dependent methyltransferase [Spirochaetales bacterium]|nr:class I SAM-dependent methyltransferase [Spirochaetales bacterium]